MNAEWSLAAAFLASHPADAARVLERGGGTAGAAVLARCSPQVIASTLGRMDPAPASTMLSRLPADSMRDILSELSLDVSTRVLRPLDPSEREKLLAAARPETARSLRAALLHAEGTAGALMDSNAPTLPSDFSAAEARRHLRRRSRRTGNYVYVVDERHRPAGALSLAELMLAPPGASLASLMRSSVAQIPVSASVQAILAHRGWRALHALPVVDAGGVLVGVLRRETYERLREEAAVRKTGGGSGFGLALAEMFWTLSLSAADELGRFVRQDASRRDEGRDGE